MDDKQVLLIVLPFPEDMAKEIAAKIKSEFSNFDYHFILQPHELKKNSAPGGHVDVPKDLLKRVAVLVTLSYLPPTAADIPNIQFIQFISAGINHVSHHPIYTDSDIVICSANGVHGPQIAEWVIMMDLVHHHGYIQLYEQQRAKVWKSNQNAKDRVGRTVGVLGYGSIGRQVARVAKAMGMNVLAYTASPRKTPDSRRDDGFIVPGTGDPEGEFPSAWYSGLDKESLHEFLKLKIDLLVLAVPLTKATTHFISTKEFELLHAANPSGTYLANIARGQIVDQPALVKALEGKLISGAALDVTDPEPLPADDPLWEAPNVLITPHVSAVTDTLGVRIFEVVRENLRRKRDGKPLVNLVNRKKGY